MSKPAPFKKDSMKLDRYNCRADYEQELIGEAERERHDQGECDGAPRCDWCVRDAELGEESMDG